MCGTDNFEFVVELTLVRSLTDHPNSTPCHGRGNKGKGENEESRERKLEPTIGTGKKTKKHKTVGLIGRQENWPNNWCGKKND